MRTLILACVVMLSVVPASAQQFTVAETVIPQQQRQGTFQSGSRVVGDALAKTLRIQIDIAAADYVIPENSVWIRVYRSVDDGATWLPVMGARWVGGSYTDEFGVVNPLPYLEKDFSEYRGQLVRVEVDVPNRMRVGATILS